MVFFYTALAWPRLPADVPNRVMWSLLIPSAVAAALAFAPTVVIGAVSSGEFLGEASRLLDRYASITHFFEPRMINGHMADGDGPIKTFSLRGIKDSPPYLHDGRLLTLEDTIEFFNLVLQLDLSEREKADLLAFLYTL